MKRGSIFYNWKRQEDYIIAKLDGERIRPLIEIVPPRKPIKGRRIYINKVITVSK